MYLRYSLGFLIASLVQAGVVMLSESLNISSLNAKLTLSQLITHIIVGQAAGYLLLFIMRRVESAGKANTGILGVIFGIIVWAVVLPTAAAQGVIQPPWQQGAATVLSSLLAFILYGTVSAYTIKNYGLKQVEL